MRLALINRSTVVSDLDIDEVAQALSLQIKQDFFPYWGIKVNVHPVHRDEETPHGAIPIRVSDSSDYPGALGYHTWNTRGPISKVFAKTCEEDRVTWSSVASHEALEMLADPTGATAALNYKTGVFYTYEVCDAVEAWGYNIMDGDWEVSNFVFPSWYVPNSRPPWDFMQVTPGPFKLAPHGGDDYIETLDVTCASEWKQITARSRDEYSTGERARVRRRSKQ